MSPVSQHLICLPSLPLGSHSAAHLLLEGARACQAERAPHWAWPRRHPFSSTSPSGQDLDTHVCAPGVFFKPPRLRFKPWSTMSDAAPLRAMGLALLKKYLIYLLLMTISVISGFSHL